MTRDEAERAYVEAIMERGNPRYFVRRVLDDWCDEDLIEHMTRLGIVVDEFEEEE